MNGEFYYHPGICRVAVIIVQADGPIIDFDLIFSNYAEYPSLFQWFL